MPVAPNIGAAESLLPRLPVEVVEDIIDEALSESSTLDASVISSIALTSHIFRIHANKARFSSLTPFREDGQDMDYTAESIRGLADVMKGGNSIHTMPGVGAFATSFSLKMIGYHSDVMPALDDGCLAYIFDNLFRPCPTYTPSSATATLSLSLSIYWSGWYYKNEGGLRWSSMNSELQEALRNLLQFSQVNRLCLEDMRDIPRDFLQGSRVKHLCLRDVSIYPSVESFHSHANMSCKESVPLESLVINGLVSSVDDEMIAHPHSSLPVSPGNMHSRLTDLSMDVRYESEFKQLNKILYNSPALRSLSVRLWIEIGRSFLLLYPFMSNDPPILLDYWKDDYIIYYSNMAMLQCLSFLNHSETPVSLISHLLKHNLPPNVKDLQIVFTHNEDSAEDIANILERKSIGVLEDDLMHPVFDSIPRITISLEVELQTSYREYRTPNYLTQWHTQLAKEFPLLLEKNAGLEIAVRWKD